jgi:hypothetical protein
MEVPKTALKFRIDIPIFAFPRPFIILVCEKK